MPTPDIEKLRELASEMLAALLALYEACERRANEEGGDFGDDIGPAAELADAAIAKAALLDSLPSPEAAEGERDTATRALAVLDKIAWLAAEEDSWFGDETDITVQRAAAERHRAALSKTEGKG